MIIKSVGAKSIFDFRKEKTISVTINTNVGKFSSSSPSGKSTGKFEKKIYKKDLETDIKTLKKFSDYFSEEVLEKFEDLRRIEDILDRHVGANTIFAIESAALKAMAKEKNKQVWEIINSESKKFPRLVGNCIGGGLHSKTKNKKPDFQEFLIISDRKNPTDNYESNKKIQKEVGEDLKTQDKNFEDKKNDENAWITSLNEKEILELLKKKKVPLGVDVAASSFYGRKKYRYENPMLTRVKEEQLGYISNLIKNFNLFYVEDPLEEEDFEGFAKLTKKFPDSLIVGDDLIVTNSKRLEKAIKMGSVSAIIVKPNQCGSLIEVERVCNLAKKNNIKVVFSHRSGETGEDILADLAFGFQADFLKCGVDGKGRVEKIKRLIEIQNSLS